MEFRSLGTSGLKVSALSLGTLTFGASNTVMVGSTSTDEEARQVFDAAVERGVNLIDTANIYSEGRAEELVGEWSASKRHKLLIASKCRFAMGLGFEDAPGPHDQGLSRKHIMDACEASLRRLKTDYIDLYQMHMQDMSVRIDETLRALSDLVTQGKVRYIGCTNYTGYRLLDSLWAAEKHGTHRFESTQVQWSLLERGAEREVVPTCQLHGVGIMAWSPLSGGFLSGKYRRGQPPPAGTRLAQLGGRRTLTGEGPGYDVVEAVEKIAKRRDATTAQVAIAWLLAKKGVSSVLIGARSVEQLDDNMGALKVKLTVEEVRQLDEVSAPEWGYPYAWIAQRQASRWGDRW